MWMLDTDTVSYIMRQRPHGVRRRFESTDADRIVLSSIVLAELYYGAVRSPNAAGIRGQIDRLVHGLTVVSWGPVAAEHFGDIRFRLEQQGTSLAAQDMMIAAHARSLQVVLVTNNLKHFGRVPRLKLENWV